MAHRTGWKSLLRLLPLLVTAGLCGCANRFIHDPDLRTHVIDIDHAGNPVDPVCRGILNNEDYSCRLKEIFDSIEGWSAKYVAAHPQQTPKILIFVHGGMVDETEAIKRAHKQWKCIRDAGYYPIFVTWDSDPWSTYGEHLFSVRHGALSNIAWISSPLYLAADLGRAIAEAPIVWVDSFTHDGFRIGADVSAWLHNEPDRRWTDNLEERTSVKHTTRLLDVYKKPDTRANAMPISVGTSQGRRRDSIDRIITYVLFWPFKLVLAPPLDGGGHAMWENMSRRTNIMFEGAGVTNVRNAQAQGNGRALARRGSSDAAAPKEESEPDLLDHPPGAMTLFLEKLEDRASHASGASPKYEITLVGHSMGCIVLNEFIRRSRERIEYQNIVYMAAACTVRDFERTVVPYLKRHEKTNFYNLCLHPANDVRERNAFDLVPRGSLLVWLDDFLTEPRTPLDRTLGRWDNLVETTWVIPTAGDSRKTPATRPADSIRPQVHLKMFDLGFSDKPTPGHPQNHGDFSEQAFWDEEFWKPLAPDAAPTRTQQFLEQRAPEAKSRQHSKAR